MLYRNINHIKLLFNDNVNVNSYLHLSNYKYKNRYQFIYLVDYYCNNIYKKDKNINIDTYY